MLVSLLNLGAAAFQTDSVLGSLYSGVTEGDALGAVTRLFSTATSRDGLSLPAGLLNTASTVFITPLVTGGITLITLSVCHGEEGGTRGDWFSRIKGIYLKLVGTGLAGVVVSVLFVLALLIPLVIVAFAVTFSGGAGVTVVITILMVLLMLLAIFLWMPYLMLAVPVAIQERRFGFKAYRRAWQLFRRKMWKSVGVVFLTAIIAYVLAAALGTVAAILPPLFAAVLNTVINALVSPISAIAVTLLYLDIRMTVEGYDLELRSAAMQDDENERNAF